MEKSTCMVWTLYQEIQEILVCNMWPIVPYEVNRKRFIPRPWYVNMYSGITWLMMMMHAWIELTTVHLQFEKLYAYPISNFPISTGTFILIGRWTENIIHIQQRGSIHPKGIQLVCIHSRKANGEFYIYTYIHDQFPRSDIDTYERYYQENASMKYCPKWLIEREYENIPSEYGCWHATLEDA